MPHYVYILECKGNRLYTGYSTDVEKRFESHLSGKGAKFTKAFTPIKIVWQKECLNKNQAMSLEHKIKALSKLKKIQLCKGKISTDDLLD